MKLGIVVDAWPHSWKSADTQWKFVEELCSSHSHIWSTFVISHLLIGFRFLCVSKIMNQTVDSCYNVIVQLCELLLYTHCRLILPSINKKSCKNHELSRSVLFTCNFLRTKILMWIELNKSLYRIWFYNIVWFLNSRQNPCSQDL